MTKRKKTRGAFLFTLVILALTAVGYGTSKNWFREGGDETLGGVPVRRGPLLISELSRGNLKSKDAARLINGLEGSTTIIFLKEEGSTVEEGDLICELDVSNLEDRRVTQEIEVKSAEAALTKSVEQYEIQEIQNETDEEEAQLAFMLAELDLEKFVDLTELPEDYDPHESEPPSEGEWAHELAQGIEAIQIAKLEQAQSEETLKWTQDLHDQGFVQRTELERDRLSVERSKIKVEQALREYELARKYGYQRKLAELQADVQRRDRDILKVQKQAVAKLADLEAERESDRYRLERERERMVEIEEQLAMGKIYAPVGGMLVYQRSGGHRGFGGEIPKEGGAAHERQVIATIPRSGGMTVDVSLHETKLDNVHVGQQVQVKVDAIPGRVFMGRVEYVAAVADSGSWMSNPNQRLYKTEVTMEESTEQMRPGMSCQIEILIEDLQDVLYVPRQSVYLDGSKTVCFVNAEGVVASRAVKVGLDNNKWVVIESGLEEGEEILLAPPPSWQPTEVEQGAAAPKRTGASKQGGRTGASPGGDRGAKPGAKPGGDRGGKRQ